MKKLFLSGSLLLGLISFSTAHAELIICKPVEVGLVKSVTIDRSKKVDTMRIQYMDSSVAVGAAEFGDDVDAVYFISEKLNAQLNIFPDDRQTGNQMPGELIRDFPDSKSEFIEVRCTRW